MQTPVLLEMLHRLRLCFCELPPKAAAGAVAVALNPSLLHAALDEFPLHPTAGMAATAPMVKAVAKQFSLLLQLVHLSPTTLRLPLLKKKEVMLMVKVPRSDMMMMMMRHRKKRMRRKNKRVLQGTTHRHLQRLLKVWTGLHQHRRN